MKDTLETAVQIAKEAGKIIRENLGKALQVEYKGKRDLVTEIDKRCEELIYKKIGCAFPRHGFMGEEGTRKSGEDEYVWIVDPLDGTTNFTHGYPFVAVSLALEFKGKIILGVVHDPILKETFASIKGKGASLDCKPIHVSKSDDISKSLLATGFSYDFKQDPGLQIKLFDEFIMLAQAVRRDGAAALDLCYIAMGRFDGFWEMKLHPWDTAAGVLILKEAGGVATDFKGKDYSIYDQEIIASNGLLHKPIVEAISKHI